MLRAIKIDYNQRCSYKKCANRIVRLCALQASLLSRTAEPMPAVEVPNRDERLKQWRQQWQQEYLRNTFKDQGRSAVDDSVEAQIPTNEKSIDATESPPSIETTKWVQKGPRWSRVTVITPGQQMKRKVSEMEWLDNILADIRNEGKKEESQDLPSVATHEKSIEATESPPSIETTKWVQKGPRWSRVTVKTPVQRTKRKTPKWLTEMLAGIKQAKHQDAIPITKKENSKQNLNKVKNTAHLNKKKKWVQDGTRWKLA